MRDAQTGRSQVAWKAGTRNVVTPWVAFLALVAGTSGCGAGVANHVGHSWYTPPAGLPRFEVDVDASSVEYDGNNSPDLSDTTELRDVVASQLRERLARSGADGEVQFARFRAKYRVTRRVWPLTWWVLCIDTQVVGCPTGHATVNAEIDLQVGNLLYRGKGEAFAVGGFYYGYFTGTPTALATATEGALQNLAYAGTVGRPLAPSATSGAIHEQTSTSHR